jgi:hypothetical protein
MSDLTEGGKALVQAGRQADRPSNADRERVLALLQVRLGDAALLATGVTQAPLATSGASSASSKFGKWGWVGSTVLVAGAAWLVPHLAHESEKPGPAPSANVVSAPSAPAVVVAAAPEPLSPSAANSAPDVPRVPDGVSRAIDPQKGAPRSRDGLAEEVALLSRAETELHAGRPAKALLALAEHQRKFPRGALSEERTAARIQALCALGRTDEANAQLRQLLHISPNSALEERARQACREPRSKSL